MLKEQMVAFLISLLCGGLCAFVYDVFRTRRRAYGSRGLIVGIEDLIFWVVAAIAIFITILYANSGLTRGFVFLGVLLGAVLYGVLLSEVVQLLLLNLFRLIGLIVKWVLTIVIWPLKQLYIIISYPLKWIYRAARKIFRWIHSVVKRWMVKLSPIRAIKRRVARHARKRKRGRIRHVKTT